MIVNGSIHHCVQVLIVPKSWLIHHRAQIPIVLTVSLCFRPGLFLDLKFGGTLHRHCKLCSLTSNMALRLPWWTILYPPPFEGPGKGSFAWWKLSCGEAFLRGYKPLDACSLAAPRIGCGGCAPHPLTLIKECGPSLGLVLTGLD